MIDEIEQLTDSRECDEHTQRGELIETVSNRDIHGILYIVVYLFCFMFAAV